MLLCQIRLSLWQILLLFYAPDHDLRVPQIPDNPSAQDVRNAVNLILEVYCDFPYDSIASRTNMLAATATPIYRPMILGCTPLGIITKPQAGTGAGLSTEAMCVITTGRDALMMGAPRDEDEWEKKLLAVLKRGQTVITIDNVDGQLYSAQLARFITAKTVQGRILGQTQDLILPNRATWLVNGNNVSPAGDIPRRSYLVSMETQADRPWERKVIFKHDPIIPWVKANRGQIVAAYLTLAKAWIAAGKPLDDSLPRLGGFEDWVHVIGGIFKYVGIDGFLGNIENVYQTAENGTWETFIEAISNAFKCSEDFTVADIVDLITAAHKDDEIPETGLDLLNSLPDMVDRDPRKLSRSLGHALNTKNDVKWHNGLVIFKTNAKRHGAVIWKVRNKLSEDFYAQVLTLGLRTLSKILLLTVHCHLPEREGSTHALIDKDLKRLTNYSFCKKCIFIGAGPEYLRLKKPLVTITLKTVPVFKADSFRDNRRWL
jgi:hypothetical protein